MNLPRLMLVTDRHRVPPGELVPRIAAAWEGGVRFVQVREKDLAPRELERVTREIRSAVPRDTEIVVNGSSEVALSVGCGLHLPASAPPLRGERPRLYGRSAHDPDEARFAVRQGVDYLVVGPVFPTPSKPGHPGGGTDLIRQLLALAGDVPVYAIGGVRASNVGDLLQAGAHGVAVCGALLENADARNAAAEFIAAAAVGEPS